MLKLKKTKEELIAERDKLNNDIEEIQEEENSEEPLKMPMKEKS